MTFFLVVFQIRFIFIFSMPLIMEHPCEWKKNYPKTNQSHISHQEILPHTKKNCSLSMCMWYWNRGWTNDNFLCPGTMVFYAYAIWIDSHKLCSKISSKNVIFLFFLFKRVNFDRPFFFFNKPYTFNNVNAYRKNIQIKLIL